MAVKTHMPNACPKNPHTRGNNIIDKLPESELGKRLSVFHCDKEMFAKMGIPEPKPGDDDYLNSFDDGAVVDAAALVEAGVISACPYGLKVLANGTLTKKITVKAAAFSESAKEKIEQAGGKAEVV